MASHWDKSLLEALMQGGGDVVELDEAVVDRGGIEPKGVAHDGRLGSLEKAARVAEVAEVFSPAVAAMKGYVQVSRC